MYVYIYCFSLLMYRSFICVKASANNLNNDVNFEHLVEHDLSCAFERVDKDVSGMGGLRFGTIDELLDESNKKRSKL